MCIFNNNLHNFPSSGSEELSACTPTSDTQCKCKTGFIPIYPLKEDMCTCEKGSGIDERGTH